MYICIFPIEEGIIFPPCRVASGPCRIAIRMKHFEGVPKGPTGIQGEPKGCQSRSPRRLKGTHQQLKGAKRKPKPPQGTQNESQDIRRRATNHTTIHT